MLYNQSRRQLTISVNQVSNTDRWLGVITVKARPIPNLGSQYTTFALVSKTPWSLRIRNPASVPLGNGFSAST
jgi:hypothetical protein